MTLPAGPLREVVTIDGTNVTLQVKDNPVENLGVLTAKELFHYLNIFDDKYQPSNYNKADGTPLRLFDSKPVKIDVSKRSKEDMGFWHRNVRLPRGHHLRAGRAALGDRDGRGDPEGRRGDRHPEGHQPPLHAVRRLRRGERADRAQGAGQAELRGRQQVTATQHADLIVRNIDWLISVDATRRVIRDAGVAIRGGQFVAVGKSADIERGWHAATVVDGRGTVATPGMIDNHLHSSFQMSRGLADEANAQSFLFDHMYPYEGAMTEEDVYVSASLASIELLRHGVTCFIDPGNYHPDATVRAIAASGLRMVISRSCFDKTKSVMGLLPERMIESTAVCLAQTEELFDKYRDAYGGRVSPERVVPRPQQRVRRADPGAEGDSRRSTTRALQTHACFSYSTHDSSVSQYGKPEIERLESLGVLDEDMLLVHSGWLEPHEFALLAKRKPTLVAAPTSSVHNGYGNINVGKLPELMALGVNVSLGSDHACSGRRRHGAGDASLRLRLQGSAHRAARHAARARGGDGDDQRRARRGAWRTASAASRSARTRTSCCSTPRCRSGSRSTTRCRISSTAPPATR